MSKNLANNKIDEIKIGEIKKEKKKYNTTWKERKKLLLEEFNEEQKEKEKYRYSFINTAANNFIKHYLTVKEIYDIYYINGKYKIVEYDRKIIYLTFSYETHSFLKDNRGTDEYKINFYKIQEEIDRCSKFSNKFQLEPAMEYFILRSIVRNLGYITMPHCLAEFLNLDLETILNDIEDKKFPYYQLGLRVYIPTASLIEFIRVRKLGYDWCNKKTI